jgi:hypothetical protein
MINQPGFFSFRWHPQNPGEGAEDIAVVFKIPGAIEQAVLPDLIEDVCLGPIVPSAVVILQLGDDGLVDALKAESLQNALARFNGRMPLLVYTIRPAPFSVHLEISREAQQSLGRELTQRLSAHETWIQAGLAAIFEAKSIVVTAPTGYAFRKPSSTRSTYFIRAELGLSTSASVFFAAFAIFMRLLRSYGRVPNGLRLLLVDTMNVAPIAFALRDILSISGVDKLPQVESFHSYGGINKVRKPLPDTSLCIVSASSSMNLHRKWIKDNSLSSRDVITLVTFEDAIDAEYALFGLAKEARPNEVAASSAFDIRIEGEYFFPVMEPPRKVLLTTTHHGCHKYTADFFRLRGRGIFSTFAATAESSRRRSLFIHADALLDTCEFQQWVNSKVPQFLKAGTATVICQDDRASIILGRHVGYIAEARGCKGVKVILASEVGESTIDREAPIVCVAAVVGAGNSLLSLSRDLRSYHIGARLYLIGLQISESAAQLDTFDRNLKHSASKSPMEVLRRYSLLSSESVTESFQLELGLYLEPRLFDQRRACLHKGPDSTRIFLPSGPDMRDELLLNPDFAFWAEPYDAGPYHAEVLATISSVL